MFQISMDWLKNDATDCTMVPLKVSSVPTSGEIQWDVQTLPATRVHLSLGPFEVSESES
jgi:hypothetical protein